MGKGKQWIHILYENLVDSLIWEETFKITIENVNHYLVYCTRLMVSLHPTNVKGWPETTLHVQKGAFCGGFRPHLLKINTAVYEDIKCQF